MGLSPVSMHLSCAECHLLNREMALATVVFEPRNLTKASIHASNRKSEDCEESSGMSGMSLHALLGRRRILLATVVGSSYLDLIHPPEFNKFVVTYLLGGDRT